MGGPFWSVVAGAALLYLALFAAARRPVALRLGRLAGAGAVAVAIRLAAAAAGWPLAGGTDGALLLLTVAATTALGAAGRIWLLRADPETVREQLETAAAGLFLRCEELEWGRIRLIARGDARELRLREPLPGISALSLPVGPCQGKIALLLNWLGKQYPGPLPRLRIRLTRSDR